MAKVNLGGLLWFILTPGGMSLEIGSQDRDQRRFYRYEHSGNVTALNV
jgi:hypothetical protein